MSNLTEARVRELAREEIRAAAQPESKPVDGHPVPPCPKCASSNVYMEHCLLGGEHFAMRCQRCRYDWRLAVDKLPPAPVQPVAPRECDHAACLSEHPGQTRCCACGWPISGAPAVPQPAPSATVASDWAVRVAEAQRVLDAAQRCRSTQDGLNFCCKPIGHREDECHDGDRLRWSKAALSPAQLRGMVDAIGGGK